MAGRALALMKAGDSTGLHALFNGRMKAAVPEERLRLLLLQLVEQRGPLVDLEPIELSGNKGTFRLRAERGAWRLEVTVDSAGAIGGMWVKPPDDKNEEPTPVVKSQLALGLPFRGEWFVFWGGGTRELNYHVDHESQRRAADLVVVDETGSSHRGDGRANGDYYAHGKEVLAVADGAVITAVDGIPDNQPGEMNPLLATGNLVILDHGAGLFSAYAHLVPGSLKVKVGARVKRGQVLGACGNSGNSSEPHLHFQLMDGPRFEKSRGVEPVFADVEVTRDGKRARQAAYTWRKGDRVHAPK